mgnify:CR=1 FL=1
MAKHILPILIMAFIVSACTSTSPTCELPRAVPSEETTIVIYRPDAFYGILYSTPFAINGCRVKDVSNNSYHVYKLPAGTHQIAAEKKIYASGGDADIIGEFEKGKTYYLHYAMTPGDFYSVGGVSGFTTSTNFAVVSKEFAYKTMPKLEEDKI